MVMGEPTDEQLLSPLAANVVRFRRRLGLSADELAGRAGVDPVEVVAVEAGLDVPVVVWVRIAAVLGVTPQVLLDS